MRVVAVMVLSAVALDWGWVPSSAVQVPPRAGVPGLPGHSQILLAWRGAACFPGPGYLEQLLKLPHPWRVFLHQLLPDLELFSD